MSSWQREHQVKSVSRSERQFRNLPSGDGVAYVRGLSLKYLAATYNSHGFLRRSQLQGDVNSRGGAHTHFYISYLGSLEPGGGLYGDLVCTTLKLRNSERAILRRGSRVLNRRLLVFRCNGGIRDHGASRICDGS